MRDKNLAAHFRKLPCRVCFSKAGVTGHHILTVGAYPQYKNVRENIIPLCFDHHRQIHDIGTTAFVLEHCLEVEMHHRGFEFNDYTQKWFIPQQ